MSMQTSTRRLGYETQEAQLLGYPTNLQQGRPRLKKAIADAYSPFFGRTIDPDKEVTITTGANEGMLSAFMGFIEPGDEVIIFEPFFDQYLSNIEMPGGKVRYVPMSPPEHGATKTSSAGDWQINFDAVEKAINEKTKMIVSSTSKTLSRVIMPMSFRFLTRRE